MGRSYQQRVRLVREWKRSGLKAAEFARKKGIKRQALHNWSWQLNKQAAARRQERSVSDVRLLPVHVTPSPRALEHVVRHQQASCLFIAVDLDGRIRIEVAPDTDLRRVATLIALLRGSQC
jgi:hypothetical protein